MISESLAAFEQAAKQLPWFAPLIALLFGAMVGSFLNVVIFRLPKRLEWEWAQACIPADTPTDPPPPDIVFPRSHCRQCGHQLAAWENIPIVSYLLLRARCRECGSPISARYPIIELVTALLTAWIFSQWGLTMQALLWSVFGWFLIAMVMIDHDHQLLPDVLTLPLLWIGLLASTAAIYVPAEQAITGACFGYLSLWSVYQVHHMITGKEGMGHGDFKLLAAIGAWGGWSVLPATILMASFSGAVIGLLAQRSGNLEKGSPMAFGPYLGIAGFINLIYGDQIIQAYFELMR